MWNPILVLSHMTSLMNVSSSIFRVVKCIFCSQNHVLIYKFLLFGRSHCPHIFLQSWSQISICSPLCFTTLYIRSTGKWEKAINPWIAVLCVGCPPVFTTDPHGKPACRASASHHVFPKLWKCILHCLRHPWRSGAKGLQVHLLPVFRRFWLRRGYQPSRKWAVAALDLPAYFMKKKYYRFDPLWSP